MTEYPFLRDSYHILSIRKSIYTTYISTQHRHMQFINISLTFGINLHLRHTTEFIQHSIIHQLEHFCNIFFLSIANDKGEKIKRHIMVLMLHTQRQTWHLNQVFNRLQLCCLYKLPEDLELGFKRLPLGHLKSCV